jgi:hypothetical protein
MANPYEAFVPSALQSLMAGEQGYNFGRGIVTQRSQDAARQQAQDAMLAGDTRSALARLIGANDPRMVQALGAYESAANTVYGTPIYGTGPGGETQIGTFDKSGRFRPIDTGGFRPTPGIRTVDTGTGTVVLDSRSGQPVAPQAPGQMGQRPAVPGQTSGYIPKDVAGEAREKRFGTEVGERQADLGRAKSAMDSSVAGLDRMATQANEVLNHPGLGRITGLVGALPNVPGFPGADAQAKLETLKSQVGFSVLQAMRDASKTGGALGQVSDFENRTLQNNLAELQNAQSLPQFKAALQKIIDYAGGAKDRLRQAYDQDYANIPKPNPSAQPTTQTAPAGAQKPVTKTIGNKTYYQVNGQWFEQ